MPEFAPPTVRRSVACHRWLKGLVAALMLFGGVWAWRSWARPEARAERLWSQARAWRTQRAWREAEQAAAAAVALDPRLGGAALLAAECAAAQDDYERALVHAGRTQSADRRSRVRAALLAAQWNRERLYRLDAAEAAYRAALELEPDNRDAATGLATLLALCGRRREAIPFALQTMKQGEPTDLLVLLARDDGVVKDPETLQRARAAAPEDVNALLGAAWHATAAQRPDEALELLQTALRLRPSATAVYVALGQQWFAAGRLEELAKWVQHAPADADDWPECWLTRARLAERADDLPGAIRCYGEALRRAPESKTANFRLARLLAETGRPNESEEFAQHLHKLQELETLQNRVLFTRRHENLAPLLELVQAYEAAGRLWEAYGWCLLAVQAEPAHAEAQRRLARLRTRVTGLPLRLTADEANAALAFDLSRYPLPRFDGIRDPSSVNDESGPVAAPTFRDDAPSAGLGFRYCNGTIGEPTRRMFEFTGGGVGVLDYDVDGVPDVFFTQGHPWPPAPRDADWNDRLFRNEDGERFVDVTASAGLRESGFGQGVAVGDVDADGFPDLYVANIGANVLWLNNGDGTFRDATAAAGVAGASDDWTTSCVLADLDGDALPDIYAVNYVTAPDVFERICAHGDGSPKMCMPFDFPAQADRFWRNDGRGGFRAVADDALSASPGGKGLGASVWDADGDGRLSLLVANDTTPNFFFTRDAAAPDARWIERGLECGLALNGDGKATGCMGVALGDVDDDGRLDVLISNFLGESNTLFVSPAAGQFEDRTREFGLREPSLKVLGFGTQFLDADLDGRLELFVANGHIDDWRAKQRPYRMPPHFFRRSGRRFELMQGADLGPYFTALWLGRAVARLDWNGDGREDLAVGHLGDDAALLTNSTRDAGRCLALRLVGVACNRDALGASATCRIGGRTLVRQVTAGDGYQASNERRLVIGAGQAERIDELVVRWPSGAVQRFTDVPVPQSACLVEGRELVRLRPLRERR